MNEVLRQLAERRSVRAYTDEPVSDADRAAVLQAAFDAPTAGCQQLYTIIDVTDPKLKHELAETCDHQPFIERAPLVLVFCADHQRWFDAYRLAGAEPRQPGEGDLVLAVLDAAIAAQNAVTAAHSLGLGSCYIGDILENRARVIELLGLPPLVVPAVMVVVGHPTPQQLTRAKPQRFASEFLVHDNVYRRLGAGELRAMFEGHTHGQGFDTFLRAFCARKYNAEFSEEMTRSVAAYLGAFRQADAGHAR